MPMKTQYQNWNDDERMIMEYIKENRQTQTKELVKIVDKDSAESVPSGCDSANIVKLRTSHH